MSTRWALPPLTVGDLAPAFAGVTRTNPAFHFTTVAGRFILLALMPRDAAARDAAIAAAEPLADLFEGRRLAAFFVAREPLGGAVPPDRMPGQRWFFDPQDLIAPKLNLQPEEAAWLLFDPALRLLDRAPIDRPEALFARITFGLPPLQAYAGPPMIAPVLIIPRVFDRDFCRQLIGIYDDRGGQPSGVMRDVGGRTVGVMDGMKSRSDVTLTDPPLRADIVARIQRSVAPMMRRTFQFNPSRIERYTVACYDAAEGGFFHPHRDNESVATAHRRFACSINLNAEDYDGGDLRFPEFGPRTYRPPTGGAVVFNCNLLHEATPVTRGRRYAFLPFFYDEEGQRIRERNLALLDAGAPAAEPTR